MIKEKMKEDFISKIENKIFPCVAAKAALAKEQLKIFTAGHMACPHDDKAILNFVYNFIDGYRKSEKLFHSAIIIFPETKIYSEAMFETIFWSRLQALADLDAENYDYDERVDSEPESESFSFSLGGEAFFVIGVHPCSGRKARQFPYPAIIFNPHAQFEQLRKDNQYEKMKTIIRKKDVEYSGSINPMLKDFGEASEVYQYTGQHYGNEWKCPFHSNHNHIKHEHNKSA